MSRAVTTGFTEAVPVPGSACNAEVTQEELSEGLHVATCARTEYTTNPPSSGPHYPQWASFRIYDEPVARGHWMHSLEHGAVAILHACRDCGEEIQNAQALIADLPEDPICALAGLPTPNRALMTPDPLLDVPWAAAAWGHTLRSDCFEVEIFREFALEHLGRGPENTCAPGAFAP